jgi:secondary thiamine-phosphate synthase enzyme
MVVFSKDFKIKTVSDGMVDITDNVSYVVSESKLNDGVVVVFCPGSTGAVSTVEYEPGLLKDVPRALEKIAPSSIDYEHHKTWHDDNGRSHVKSTLIGPSLTVPFRNRKLVLGTWQQIVFMEFDTSPRERTVVVQVLGE